MKASMGTIDRVTRLILALVITMLFYAQIFSGTVGIVLIVLGAILLVTSIVKYYPIYFPFGASTCKRN